MLVQTVLTYKKVTNNALIFKKYENRFIINKKIMVQSMQNEAIKLLKHILYNQSNHLRAGIKIFKSKVKFEQKLQEYAMEHYHEKESLYLTLAFYRIFNKVISHNRCFL